MSSAERWAEDATLPVRNRTSCDGIARARLRVSSVERFRSDSVELSRDAIPMCPPSPRPCPGEAQSCRSGLADHAAGQLVSMHALEQVDNSTRVCTSGVLEVAAATSEDDASDDHDVNHAPAGNIQESSSGRFGSHVDAAAAVEISESHMTSLSTAPDATGRFDDDHIPKPFSIESNKENATRKMSDVVKLLTKSRPLSAETRRRARERRESRFQNLYRDNEVRQRKWLARRAEKCKEEVQEAMEKSAGRGARSFDHRAFNNWYSDRMGNHVGAAQARRDKQLAVERLREEEEAAHCTFKPQTRTRLASRPAVAEGWTSPTARRCTSEDRAVAEELIAAQAEQVEAIRKLDAQQVEHEAAAKCDSDTRLSLVLAECSAEMERFAQTSEGMRALSEKVCQRMAQQEGLTEDAAMLEVREGLARSAEAKLRQEAGEALQAQIHADAQRMNLARLLVVRALIRLHGRHEELITSRSVPPHLLQGFDLELLDSIKAAPWYQEARASADRSLRNEAEIAAESLSQRAIHRPKVSCTTSRRVAAS